ncbi:MAG TPA: 50S ribosomal protein L16 [archaeon]|nr:50S ribosomal protein L16 [archaeon]
MGLRPGRCYREINKKPWTRISIRRPRRSYVKGVPASKIHQFEMGNVKGEFEIIGHIVANDDAQIRSNALEATRTIVVKYLEKKLGEGKFFVKIRAYPHHVLRENAMATGAGADRFSQGMGSLPFGRPIGIAARVHTGQKLITMKVPAGSADVIKVAFDRASKKLPLQVRLLMENNSAK